MNPPGREGNKLQDNWTFYEQDLNNLVAERRRTDADRARLGIPAEGQQFYRVPAEQAHFPPTQSLGLTSISKSSARESSPPTSYTQSLSAFDATQSKGNLVRNRELHDKWGYPVSSIAEGDQQEIVDRVGNVAKETTRVGTHFDSLNLTY